MTASARAALATGLLAAAGVTLFVGRGLGLGGFTLQPFQVVGALLVAWGGLGVLRAPWRAWVRPRRRLEILVAALLLAVGLVLAAGVGSTVHAVEPMRVVRFAFRYAFGAVVVLALVQVLDSAERIRRLSALLVAGAAASTLVSVAGFVVPALGALTIRYGDRAQGLLAHPNQLGMMLTATLPLALAPVARDYRRLHRWIVPGLIIAGVALSGSKANLLIAAALVPLVLLAMNALKRGLVTRLAAFAATGAMAVFGAAAGVYVLRVSSPRTLDTLQRLAEDPTSTSTVSNRLALWTQAVAVGGRHWPFGIGADHTGLYLRHGHAHNVLIEFFLTTGPLGVLAVTALIAAVVVLALHGYRLARRTREAPLEDRLHLVALAAGCLAYLLSNQTSDSFGSTTINLLWVMLGLLVAQARRVRAVGDAAPGRPEAGAGDGG